jgi:hypothetical protein
MPSTRKRKASAVEPTVVSTIGKKKTTRTKLTAGKRATEQSHSNEESVVNDKSIVTMASSTISTTLSNLIDEPTWANKLQSVFQTDYFQGIEQTLNDQWSSGKTIYPLRKDIFNAFNQTPFDQVKVVLIGQDPYHDDGQVNLKQDNFPEK